MRPHRFRVSALWLASLLTAVAAQAHIDSPIALTDKGLVKGSATDSMFVFRGIPYAAPPVGDLRWRPPRARGALEGCARRDRRSRRTARSRRRVFGTPSVDEDCLYLNVYVPKPTRRRTFSRCSAPSWCGSTAARNFLGESDDYDPTRLVDAGRRGGDDQLPARPARLPRTSGADRRVRLRRLGRLRQSWISRPR